MNEINNISIKAVEQKGITILKILIRHPMETGQRKDEDGKLIPINFINKITITTKNITIFTANLGPSIAKDPNLFIKTKALKKGDVFNIVWQTSSGGEKKQQGLVE